jgi:hypothetical protein
MGHCLSRVDYSEQRRCRLYSGMASVALAATNGEKTLAGPAQLYDIHPTEATVWK